MTERPLTEHIRPDRRPLSLAEYRKTGGYEAARKAVEEMAPDDVVEVVKNSGLRGRGGAGFPTGMKWGLTMTGDDAPAPRYVVANADEMEPGTFKDRLLLEGNPHQLLEGMVLAGHAIGASTGYVFLRWAYRRAEQCLRQAIDEARESGLLGENALGKGRGFDVHVHVSAGRYMCGEETGLLNALEGRRATPRAKPPYPGQSGLWGKPTIVNNVETLCCVPHIVEHGAEWFRGLAATDDAGTKLYGASGRVKRPGIYELPIGTTLGEIMDEHAGGMREGVTWRGVLPGGASTDFLTTEHRDVPLDFDSVSSAGSRLGTGTLVVLDDRTCPVGMVLNLERFFAQESCGWCTPCREGIPWVARLLERLEAGRGSEQDIRLLEHHCELLGAGTTFCMFAPGAAEPLQSALVHFRDDFDRHVKDGRCPHGGE